MVGEIEQILSDFSFPVCLAILQKTAQGVEVSARYGDTNTVYPWKSVTKLATSRVILGAVENQVLDWDTNYLPLLQEIQAKRGEAVEFRPDLAGEKKITLAHLLAHCSGLPAEAIRQPNSRQTFAASETVIIPRQKRVYSNYAYELLGELLERVSQVPFAKWLDTMIFRPLQMRAEFPEAASPAWGISSDLENLILFAKECVEPKFFSPLSQKRWLEPVCSDLAGIVPGYGRQNPCLWGSGPELKAQKGDDGQGKHWLSPNNSAKTWGHFGQSGSFLWWDPEIMVGAVFLGAKAFGCEHQKNWSNLNQIICKKYG